jgi:DNA-binding LacI/PurR family transcriptional regulator
VLSFPLDRNRAAALTAGPDPDDATFRVTRERLAGFRDAWKGDWSDVRVAVCARNTASDGEHAALALLTGPDASDAVAAMSDVLALGVLRAAQRAGVRVALTGWDDTDAAAAADLTTISQSLHAQGARCARLALGEPVEGDVDWTLVRRGSTAVS